MQDFLESTHLQDTQSAHLFADNWMPDCFDGTVWAHELMIVILSPLDVLGICYGFDHVIVYVMVVQDFLRD